MHTQLQHKKARFATEVNTYTYWMLCRQFHGKEPPVVSVEIGMQTLKLFVWQYSHKQLGKVSDKLLKDIILNNKG